MRRFLFCAMMMTAAHALCVYGPAFAQDEPSAAVQVEEGGAGAVQGTDPAVAQDKEFRGGTGIDPQVADSVDPDAVKDEPASLAQDDQYDTMKIPPLPDFLETLPDEQFTEQSDMFEETPSGDKYLAYKLRLPKGWSRASAGLQYKKAEIEEAGMSQRVLGMIAKYYGPGRIDAVSRFEIEAVQLEHEVTAKNWFVHEILARGYSLEGLEVYSDRRVEALYVLVEKDSAFVVRAIAEINGPRMVVVSYYVPEGRWKEEQAMQQQAVQSFSFLSPEITKIEMTRTYSFLDLVSFEYPASWRLMAPNIYTIDDMEAKLFYSPEEKTLGGQIDVMVVSSEYEGVLEEQLAHVRKKIGEMGLVPGDLIEKRDDQYTFKPHILFSTVETYQIMDKDDSIIDHEYWLAIMEEDRYYYVITMLTPGRKGEFYNWARNGEAFKTVVESIGP